MHVQGIDTTAVNNNNVQNKTQNKNPKRSVKAIAAGLAVGVIPSGAVLADTVMPKSNSCMQMISRYIQNDMPDVDTFENIKAIAKKAIQDSGLASKGVTLKTVNDKNINEVVNELKTAIKKAPFAKNIADSFTQMFKYGANAAFEPKNNKVYIGEKGLFSSVFHEIGHALNYNSSKTMRFMQKLRNITPYGVPVLGLGLFAAGLFHRVKPESETQPKSLWEKTKDFVKNNSGKITFVSFLPMLAEEGVASIKGIKLAKKYLNPTQIKRLNKNYLSAFKSYAQVAVVLSAAIGLGNILAEHLQKKEN